MQRSCRIAQGWNNLHSRQSHREMLSIHDIATLPITCWTFLRVLEWQCTLAADGKLDRYLVIS